MTSDQAQTAVSVSAFVVAGTFAYRKVSAPSTAALPQTGHFVIGFGFTFIVLAILASAAPDLGGMMAILVATGDLLANGTSLTKDLSGALQATKTATS